MAIVSGSRDAWPWPPEPPRPDFAPLYRELATLPELR